MRNITRTLIVGIGLSVASVSLFPVLSSAWEQNAFSISISGGPPVLVMNEDQFKGKWKQFKGELKKKWGNFTDDDLLYIEGSPTSLMEKFRSVMGIGKMK